MKTLGGFARVVLIDDVGDTILVTEGSEIPESHALVITGGEDGAGQAQLIRVVTDGSKELATRDDEVLEKLESIDTQLRVISFMLKHVTELDVEPEDVDDDD